MKTQLQTLVRHEGDAPRDRSTCGWRDRLISREDSDVAAGQDRQHGQGEYHHQAAGLPPRLLLVLEEVHERAGQRSPSEKTWQLVLSKLEMRRAA